MGMKQNTEEPDEEPGLSQRPGDAGFGEYLTCS